MKGQVRLGVLGLTHDHIWDNLKDVQHLKDARLIAVADPNHPLLDRAAREYSCATYTDYETMLEKEELHAVLVYSDNATGVEVAEQAAARGLHLLVEKPMAATLAGADRMLAAVRVAKVRLMVNWPIAWWPQLQKALALVKWGEIGDIWQVKYRAAHAGPKEMGCSPYFSDWLYNAELNGAGALVDYCCYGAVLARQFLGVPSRVTGVAGRFVKEDITVDDNAVLLMTYPRGLAIAEASWTQIGHLTSYVVMLYGTKGTLVIQPGEDGKLLHASDKNPDGVVVKAPKSPAHLRNATAHFVHCLRTGEEFTSLCNDRFARDAQEILEAGLLAASTGAEVSLPLKGV
ncbi:MAG: Gfo/Idh/MocA family oxidoreductase [Verrucomicrobiota bacterium]